MMWRPDSDRVNRSWSGPMLKDVPPASSLQFWAMQGADGTSFSDHMGVAAVLGLRGSEQPSLRAYFGSSRFTNGQTAALSTALGIIRQGAGWHCLHHGTITSELVLPRTMLIKTVVCLRRPAEV